MKATGQMLVYLAELCGHAEIYGRVRVDDPAVTYVLPFAVRHSSGALRTRLVLAKRRMRHAKGVCRRNHPHRFGYSYLEGI